jgi:hypothetical protein
MTVESMSVGFMSLDFSGTANKYLLGVKDTYGIGYLVNYSGAYDVPLTNCSNLIDLNKHALKYFIEFKFFMDFFKVDRG